VTAREVNDAFTAHVGCLFKASQRLCLFQIPSKPCPASLAINPFLPYSTNRTTLETFQALLVGLMKTKFLGLNKGVVSQFGFGNQAA
jgi:hypothetical protein